MRHPELEQIEFVKHAVLNNDFLGIAIIDSRTGEIHRANEEYCCILGRRPHEVIGSHWMEFTPNEDRPADIEVIRAAHDRNKKVSGHTKRYIRPDGSVSYVRISVEPIPDKNDEPAYLVILKDETELVRAREERKDYIKEYNHVQECFFPAMAILSEFRDRETGEHILRTRKYVRLLLDNLPDGKPFSEKAKCLISNSAMLHDIGKVGIPDNILLKPGKLNPEEMTIMQSHTILGGKTINRIKHLLMDETMFMFARDIAEYHHERWDGTGYPHRLKGEEIPLTARIMTIADVYDALRSERPYKPPYSHETAVKIITEGEGSQFDPSLVSIFMKLAPEFERISKLEKETLESDAPRAW
jgi:PAS domain S-box-containing protein